MSNYTKARAEAERWANRNGGFSAPNNHIKNDRATEIAKRVLDYEGAARGGLAEIERKLNEARSKGEI